MILSSFSCFFVTSPPTPSRNIFVPSLMEVRGVLSSCDINEKKSDFILSTSLSLVDIRLKPAASSAISGREVSSRSALNTPAEISLVFFFISKRGTEMLLVIKTESRIPNSREAAVMPMATVLARAPAIRRSFIFEKIFCWFKIFSVFISCMMISPSFAFFSL
jgi:hypothetical protein